MARSTADNMTGPDAKARRQPRGAQGGPSPCLSPEAAPSRCGVWLAGLAIVLVTGTCYLNSLGNAFIYDDLASIPDNPTIRHLWPLSAPLSPPNDSWATVNGRPILNLSLAVDYAISGNGVWSYHLTNLLIHALAGLVLFGIVRRTLLLPSLRDRFGPAATGMALATAMLWAVHPMQTESVTYVIQRAESLMGLLYLLTLYGLIRSAESPRPGLWSVASVAACALAMATKEVTVTAPVLVLLYDRTFLAGSFKQAVRRRWGLYAGLAACYGVLGYVMWTAGTRGGTAGVHAEWVMDWRQYARTELGVILQYLQLSLWPGSLCLARPVPIASRPEEILPGAIVVAMLAGAALWGLCGGRKWGYPLAWLLVILAPTSSVVPIIQPMFEHRMYLSLAGVATITVVGAVLLWQMLVQRVAWLSGGSAVRRWALPGAALAAVVGVLAYLTIQRNADYRSEVTIWRDTAEKYPNYAKGRYIYGTALYSAGQVDKAIEQYDQALRLDGRMAQAHMGLANAIFRQGKAEAAIDQYHQAITLQPEYADAHYNLGVALESQGKFDAAMQEYRQAIALKSDYADACNNLAWLLATRDPSQGGDPADAVQLAQHALQVGPVSPEWLDTLAAAYASAGRFAEAVATEEKAIGLATAAGKTSLIGDLQAHMERFRAGRPWREAIGSTQPTQP